MRKPNGEEYNQNVKIADNLVKSSNYWGLNVIQPDGKPKYVEAKVAHKAFKQNESIELKDDEINYQIVNLDFKQNYKRKLNLDELMEFNQTGTYKIQIVYDYQTARDNNKDVWKGKFNGEVFTVTIK